MSRSAASIWSGSALVMMNTNSLLTVAPLINRGRARVSPAHDTWETAQTEDGPAMRYISHLRAAATARW
jgi:hypothetical protein